MKYLTFFIFLILLTQLSFTQIMYIHTHSKGIDSISISQIDSITFSAQISVSGWRYWKYIYPSDSNAYYPPAPGVFEEGSDSLVFYESGYRGGSLIHTINDYDLSNKTLYMKWKIDGRGGWGMVWISAMFIGTNPNPQSPREYSVTNMTALSPEYADNSVLISNNTWYYTRAVITSGGYITKTATSNYDDKGGTIIQEKTGTFPYFQDRGKVAIEFNDTYATDTVHTVVAEVKIK